MKRRTHIRRIQIRFQPEPHKQPKPKKKYHLTAHNNGYYICNDKEIVAIVALLKQAEDIVEDLNRLYGD